jgi:hypothetical protein
VQRLIAAIILVHSHVAGDSAYCGYQATNEDLIRRARREVGLPGNQGDADHRRARPDDRRPALKRHEHDTPFA